MPRRVNGPGGAAGRGIQRRVATSRSAATVHGASTAGVLMLVGLCVDFLADGDLDVLQLFC